MNKGLYNLYRGASPVDCISLQLVVVVMFHCKMLEVLQFSKQKDQHNASLWTHWNACHPRMTSFVSGISKELFYFIFFPFVQKNVMLLLPWLLVTRDVDSEMLRIITKYAYADKNLLLSYFISSLSSDSILKNSLTQKSGATHVWSDVPVATPLPRIMTGCLPGEGQDLSLNVELFLVFYSHSFWINILGDLKKKK